MLRSEILASLQKFQLLLVENNVEELLRTAVAPTRENKKVDPGALLAIFEELRNAYRDFSPAEQQIAQILELQPLFDAGFWAMVIGTDEGVRVAVSHLLRSIRNAHATLATLTALFTRETDVAASSSRQESNLTVVLIEEGDKGSSPKRLVMAIESIEGLYEACAELKGHDPNTLVAVSVDSGSDKIFDFAGLADVVKCVKETIVALWDLVVFHRERKFEKNLELISSALPVMQELAKLKEAEPERALKLQKQVMTSLEKFLDAGLTIPEIDAHTTQNPRALMKPEPKLLVGPSPAVAETPRDEESPSPNPMDDPRFEEFVRNAAREWNTRQRKPASPNSDTPKSPNEDEEE